MFCIHCGTKCAKSAKFCGNCGAQRATKQTVQLPDSSNEPMPDVAIVEVPAEATALVPEIVVQRVSDEAVTPVLVEVPESYTDAMVETGDGVVEVAAVIKDNTEPEPEAKHSINDGVPVRLKAISATAHQMLRSDKVSGLIKSVAWVWVIPIAIGGWLIGGLPFALIGALAGHYLGPKYLSGLASNLKDRVFDELASAKERSLRATGTNPESESELISESDSDPNILMNLERESYLGIDTDLGEELDQVLVVDSKDTDSFEDSVSIVGDEAPESLEVNEAAPAQIELNNENLEVATDNTFGDTDYSGNSSKKRLHKVLERSISETKLNKTQSKLSRQLVLGGNLLIALAIFVVPIFRFSIDESYTLYSIDEVTHHINALHRDAFNRSDSYLMDAEWYGEQGADQWRAGGWQNTLGTWFFGDLGGGARAYDVGDALVGFGMDAQNQADAYYSVSRQLSQVNFDVPSISRVLLILVPIMAIPVTIAVLIRKPIDSRLMQLFGALPVIALGAALLSLRTVFTGLRAFTQWYQQAYLNGELQSILQNYWDIEFSPAQLSSRLVVGLLLLGVGALIFGVRKYLSAITESEVVSDSLTDEKLKGFTVPDPSKEVLIAA